MNPCRAPQAFIVDRGEQVHTVEAAKALAERVQAVAAPLEEEDDLEDSGAAEEEQVEAAETEAAPATAPEQDEDGSRRRRRRRRRGGRNGGEGAHGQPHGERDEERDEQHHEQVAITESAEEFPAAADHESATDDELTDQPAGFAPQEHAGEPRREGERAAAAWTPRRPA